MGEVESTHARSGPHRKRLRYERPGTRMHIEQTPERALLGVIRACRVTCGRPDAAIFLSNKIRVAQALRTTITPFIAHAFVQAFGESLSQAIGEGLRPDRVLVIMICREPLAQIH